MFYNNLFDLHDKSQITSPTSPVPEVCIYSSSPHTEYNVGLYA